MNKTKNTFTLILHAVNKLPRERMAITTIHCIHQNSVQVVSCDKNFLCHCNASFAIVSSHFSNSVTQTSRHLCILHVCIAIYYLRI